MDEPKVDNTQVTETPQQESTPVETTAQPTTEQAVEKQAEVATPEAVDRFDKHPRFQELNQRAKNAETQLAEYKRRELETQVTQAPTADPQDPYANMNDVEAQQTKQFIEKFVMPQVEQKYQPFIRQFQTEQLNKQINQAKTETEKFGLNFDEKLPEIVDYLSRPENRGRLTATEAARNLYFEQMTNSAMTKGKEGAQAEQQELMEKKKAANLQSNTVSQKSVVQTDDLARSQMNESDKLMADIKYGIEKAKAGERHPGVKFN